MADAIEIIIHAKDEASKVIGGVRSALGGLGSGLQSAGMVAGGALLGIGAAAVGGFGVAMGAAINMNASLEQSTMQFTTLMGDADTAAEHVANLFEFGAKTPFETEPIIAASKHLQIFGGEALNSMENLTLIGDSAAAVGAPIDEVSFWVGRLYSNLQAGQPFGEAAARLQELGIMAPETKTQLEEMQKAGASGTEVFGAFQERMGSFAGAMDMQSRSWTGMMSTLSDTFSMAAANALGPFFDLAEEGLGALLGWLNSPGIQNGIASIAAGLTTVAGVIHSFIANLQEGMSPLDAFIEAIWDIAPQSVLDGLVNFRDNILPGLTTAFHNIVDPIVSWVQNNIQLKDVLIGLGIAILSAVVPAVVSLALSMAPILLAVGAVIAVVALLRNAWENNWGGIQEKTAAAIDFVRNLIQTALAAIQAFWAEHGAAIMVAVQQAWTFIQTTIQTAIVIISTIVQTVLAAIQTFWQEHGAAILATATQFWNLIKGLIDGVITQIKLIIDVFRLAFEGDWEALGAKIFEIWENAWTTVVNFLSGLWGMILPWLAGLWESIKGWFTRTDWAGLGRQIIQGIINGVRAMGDALGGVLQGIVDAAISRIKALLGISSPSRLMAYYGRMTGAGLVDGIGSQIPAVRDAIGNLLSAADVGNVAVGLSGGYQAGAAVGARGGAGVGQTTVVNIDARGAQRGVDRDLRSMVEEVLREYSVRADVRMRTG